jgi:PAS domain S-box-containing protein
MAGVGGWTIDLVSKAVTWSDETCRILGVEPGYQPTLEEAFDFYPPEARPVIQAAVDKCMATGQDWDHELPLIQVGGRRIWTRSVGAIDASDGVPVRLVGAFQDVTESRAQRLAVVEARERIELATGSGEIGIWDCNLVSGVLTWDAKMCQFYGINPSEQTSYDLWVQHLHPEDRVGTERAMEDALAGLRPFDTEFRVIRGDGSVRHLRATARIKRDDQGCAVRLVGVNWDVSTLRELALELERKEQMLHSVTDSLPMLVNYIDLQQRYRFANHTYVAWYGMPVEDIIGRRVADFLNPSTWARVEPHLQAALQGTPSVHENQLFALGQQRDLRAQFMPQWNERGQVEGVVSVITDISEYKATEQRLAQAVERATEQLHQTNAALVQRNLDLQQFAFVASHDLRTPLRSVKGLLTLLQARHASSLDAKGNDIITRATKAIGQMDELTEDLLSYARLDAPAQAFEPVDCNAVLADTLNFLDASLAQTGAQVTVEALPTLMGERGQLVQLFQNLLGNALKYCQGRTPLVQVSARRGTAEWVFQVADNGIGIAPQHLARIFEVFKRLHTAKEYSGNGIGLAICERIVVRHGGRIWVQSEPGQGSTFFFSIPDKVQTS